MATERDALIALSVETGRERCDALKRELGKLRERKYPSPAPELLIQLIERTTDHIATALNTIRSDDELRVLLTSEQLILRVYHHTEFLPFLHQILGLLEGADVERTPSALIPPLRRFLRRVLPSAEVMFTSQPELNYSFVEIAEGLKEVYRSAGSTFENLVADFPADFVVINLPSAEVQNVLLHCVTAHEIGHGLYRMDRIDEKLMALIKLDEHAVKRLSDEAAPSAQAQSNASNGTSNGLQLNKVQLREVLTSEINRTIAGWLAELSSDAIGLCLFGPAYYFAFVHFIVSFQYLDVTDTSHPAPRVRLRLMRQMIRDLGFYEKFGALKDPFDRWGALLDKKPEPKQPMDRIAFDAVDPITATIVSEAQRAVESRSLLFGANDFASSETLADMLLHLIPPIEVLDASTKHLSPTDMRAVLNAGWRVQLASLNEFAAVNYIAQRGSQLETKERLADMLLKSLELLEIKAKWNEVHATVRR